ncbi:hypothetical protein BDP81DRAFT_34133 [Colletotrichum phormii]|uniref:DNA ligase D 3'-phosphoesterase domain-containing protein n=1 Tax=Colletotrichum phormii TaxID=359342 RepID=A0AAI9ZQT6_9PEZI|nr:uncharacterized protein BDP81DRAFT_34133 [Colletotrichum phormii]KAK1636150.1 hypothetical protein BDP81DRAFT_34133 [Colletotrichum phormii]
MASKRPPSVGFIENPFIKKSNLEWRLNVPGSKTDDGGEGEGEKEEEFELRNCAADEGQNRDPVVTIITSPPHEPEPEAEPNTEAINLSAALESGAMTQPDPTTHFFTHLAQHTLHPYPSHTPHLCAGPDISVDGSVGGASLRDLFLSHAGSKQGAHFVVHQHDHPIAGVHYDLRLQVNETSSVSWAVMYGLPGDANSTRLNRNATETRVHCLWNHVVETSSDGESGDVGDGDVVPDPLDRGDGGGGEGDEKKLSAMEKEIREVEDEFVRRTNAYRGAENSVGSVYQRRWYLSLDREACGFERRSVGGKRIWVLKDGGGGGGKGNEDRGGGDGGEVDESGRLRFPFYVRGPDVERSIVTGRKGAEVLRDGCVEGFVGRTGWRPVLN